jgi:two-component system phosphate regulon response regulator PhoB
VKILIVDDDPDMCKALTRVLEDEGHTTQSSGDTTSALTATKEFSPDLMLLDIALGNEDGRDLLTRLRRIGSLPVIFITARGLEMDRINGLRMGADDYMVKPFSFAELLARIEVVKRRARSGFAHTSIDAESLELVFGELRINRISREVHLRGQLLDFTTKEFDLLAFLAASPRRVFSRQELLEHVWHSSHLWQDDSTVTEHIRRVRLKIEDDPRRPRWIANIRSVGYRFTAAGTVDANCG